MADTIAASKQSLGQEAYLGPPLCTKKYSARH